jgi:hypothetical protein
MITLDPSRGRTAPEQRTITYCDPYNGQLYDLPIISLVVLQTMQYLEALGLDPSDEESIDEHAGEIAEYLVLDGWFSEDEYVAELAREDAADLDEELHDLLEGEE